MRTVDAGQVLSLLDAIGEAIVGGTREAFCAAFMCTQVVLNLSDLELAQKFQVSRPTIGRWTRGEAAPHPVGRRPILEALQLMVLVSKR